MSVYNYKELREHLGHNVTVAMYGDDVNVSIECEDCNEVLVSYDNEEETTSPEESKPFEEFDVHVTWESYGTYKGIKARSYEEACEMVKDYDYPLPTESYYVDDSFRIDTQV